MLTFYLQHIFWVQYSERRWSVIGKGVLANVKDGIFKIFLRTLTTRQTNQEWSKFPCLFLGQAIIGWQEAF